MVDNILELIGKYGSKPFGYDHTNGEQNCAQFANNIVKELTGKDYLSDYTEKYSKKEIYKFLREKGLKEMLIETLNSTPKPVEEAKTGDVVLALNRKGQDTVGICYESYAFFTNIGSLIHKKALEDCICIWSIK